MGYQAGAWFPFGAALAGVAGALTGLLVVAPQPRIALGGELIALAALSGVSLQSLDRRAGSAGENVNKAERYIERFSPNLITAVLVGAAGVTLAVRAGGGLYWLLPAAVTSLLGGVTSA